MTLTMIIKLSLTKHDTVRQIMVKPLRCLTNPSPNPPPKKKNNKQQQEHQPSCT